MSPMRRGAGWPASILVVVVTLASIGVSESSPVQRLARGERVVYVVPVEGEIDLGLAPFVRRILQQATQARAAAVVLQINTLGGRVDAAVQIRDALLRSSVRTIAFVDPRAISAGALIALAAGTIAMAPGGTIGAATPVQLGRPGTPAQPTSEKTLSFVRKEFRATAEHRHRPPVLAEAMVDPDVAIPNVVEKGKLLTMTTTEAVALHLVDFRADTLQAVLRHAGLGQAVLRRVSPNWAESVVRFLTRPMVSSLLVTIGILGLLLELRAPGLGLAGGVGALSLALFFWGHWLVRLAGWEDLLLVAVGVALLGIEVFVIPGFGVFGVLGIAAVLAGLVMSSTGQGASTHFILEALGRVALSVLVALVAGLILLRFLPRLPFARRLVLQSGLGAGTGYGSALQTDQHWLGKTGRARSALRPAGIADIEGERVDVVSDGELIEPGEPIEVIRTDGNRIVVRHAPSGDTKE